MPNRFKDPTLRKEYDSVMGMYKAKHRSLFYADGSRCLGSSMASAFWRGFNGTTFGAGFIDSASRKTLAYACWRAGQDAKREADSTH